MMQYDMHLKWHAEIKLFLQLFEHDFYVTNDSSDQIEVKCFHAGFHFCFEAYEDSSSRKNWENMGLCGMWKDTSKRKEVDTTSDVAQPPIRESQFVLLSRL